MRAIVFDLDETLLDRRATLDCYARALHSEFAGFAAVPVDAFVDQYHRIDADGDAPRALFFERVAARLFHSVSAHELREHFVAHAWSAPQLFPRVMAMLSQLRASGWRLGIITNGGTASQGAKIANSGLGTVMDACVISADFGSRKPDTAIFHHAAARIGARVNGSWFVGDSPRADVWGASRAGLRTVWVERRKPWPDGLPRCYDARVAVVSEVSNVVADAV